MKMPTSDKNRRGRAGQGRNYNRSHKGMGSKERKKGGKGRNAKKGKDRRESMEYTV